MSKATFYDDLGKTAKDLLTKNFPVDGSFKATLVTNPQGPVTINGILHRFLKNGEEFVTVSFEPTFKISGEHSPVVAVKIGTASDFEVSVSLSNVGAPGTKTTVTTIRNKNDGSQLLRFAGEWNSEAAAVKTQFELPDDTSAKAVSVQASAVAVHNQCSVGGRVNYATAHGNSDATLSYGAKVAYLETDGRRPIWEAVLEYLASTGLKASNSVKASYFHRLNDCVTTGAEFTFDPTDLSASPSSSCVTEYEYDPKKIFLKFKTDVSASKDFTVYGGALFKQDALSVAIGVSLNGNHLLGKTSKSLTGAFGMDVKFG